MNTEYKYPKNIEKLHELKVCSNMIIGGGNLVKIKNLIPFIIGNGPIPMIWINVNFMNDIVTLIDNNISLNPQLIVVKDFEKRRVIIKTKSEIIIDAYMIEDFKCKVDILNLIPIGLNIIGNKEGLKIGETSMSGNNFSNIENVVFIDG